MNEVLQKTEETWERRLLSRASLILEKSAGLDRRVSSRVSDFVGPVPTACGSKDDCPNPSNFDAVMSMLLDGIEANIDSASDEFSRL